MNSAIAWIKSNVAIVALLGVIVVSLPAAYVGSSIWNSRIRTSREAEATKAMSDLGSLRVTYAIPGVMPGEEAITVLSEAPNPRLTEFFREQRQKREEQVDRVVTAAQEINSQGHEPLVEGVFPEPRDGRARLKLLEFAETLVGTDGRPSAYEKLFRDINAGKPADPIQLERALQDHRDRYLERVDAESGRSELTAEEEADLTTELSGLRLGFYQQHANRHSVYADMTVLPDVVPTTVSAPPALETAFRWQFDYWTIADLLRAVDNANTRDGHRYSIESAVVKRIESITLEPLLPRQEQRQAEGAQPTLGPRNPITGRSGGQQNELYDIRNARMSLIVSSSQLQELINAISRTNFMTVIGLEFEDIDPWTHLEEGYYYGSDHVVRARVRIETVWFRSWTRPLMPPEIRRILTGSEELPGEQPGEFPGGAG